MAVRLAANLRDMGLDFSMKIIGSGVMQEKLAGMIDSLGLSGIVELKGRIPTDELRDEMKNSQILKTRRYLYSLQIAVKAGELSSMKP